jgi:hypothetical protein
MKMKDTSPEVNDWHKVIKNDHEHHALSNEHKNKHSYKYPPFKADWNDKEMVDFVNELIKMHRGTYINLFTWPLALSIVKRYYDIEDEALSYITKKEENK